MPHPVLIIGAGMAGLTAARSLAAAGLRPVVLDKGRAVGGRMATRSLGSARLDHGAQHFSVRTDAFAEEVAGLVRGGAAHVWLRSRSVTRPERGVEERYAGSGGMRAVPAALAAGLGVSTGVTVERLVAGNGRVGAVADGSVTAEADAAILTPPLPQTLALLAASGVADPALDELAAVEYRATLAVMAVLDRPSGLPDGHRTPASGPIAWMADNLHKGVSAVPALTIHSSPEYAAARLEDDPAGWTRELLAAAQPYHDGNVVQAVGHRWRYSMPAATRSDGCLAIEAPVPLVLAGEVFAGARVEGAFVSGRAAASRIRRLLA